MHAAAALLLQPEPLRLDASTVDSPSQTSVPIPPATAAPFELVDGPEGRRTASNGAQALHLLDAGGRVFRRRAVKGFGSAQPRAVEWAVAELHGVRVYFDGVQVVVTTQDIYP